jgi:hypothetical protein
MNLVKQKQDQLGPSNRENPERQSLAAQDKTLPLPGGRKHLLCRSARQKVTEKLGTTFAGIGTSPLNLSGQRQKTDVL